MNITTLGTITGPDQSTWLRVTSPRMTFHGTQFEALATQAGGQWTANDQGAALAAAQQPDGDTLTGLYDAAGAHHCRVDPLGRLTTTAPTLEQALTRLTGAARQMTGTRTLRLTPLAVRTITQALTEMRDNWRACRNFDTEYQDATDALDQVRAQTRRKETA